MRSKPKSWKIGIGLVLGLLAVSGMTLLAVFGVILRSENRRPDKFVVPQGYIGYLIIEHGVKGAPPTPVINGHNLYQFSSAGRIKTSMPLDHRWGSDEYYYVTTHGLNRIPDSSEQDQDANSGVMMWDQKSGYGGGEGFPETEYAFVGSKIQHDKAERGPEPRSEEEEMRDNALATQDEADQVQEKHRVSRTKSSRGLSQVNLSNVSNRQATSQPKRNKHQLIPQ